MPEYVILLNAEEHENSSQAGMTTVENWEAQPDIYKDTPIVNERFTALCWCAAQTHFSRKMHDEKYSMYFCEEDRDNDHELCPHFDALLQIRDNGGCGIDTGIMNIVGDVKRSLLCGEDLGPGVFSRCGACAPKEQP
jgi:hypothetical protein